MVVCLNQSACFLEETVNSIKYAEKAMKIRPPPIEARISSAREVDEHTLKKRIMELEREVATLKNREASVLLAYSQSKNPAIVQKGSKLDDSPQYVSIPAEDSTIKQAEAQEVETTRMPPSPQIESLLRATPSLDNLLQDLNFKEPQIRNQKEMAQRLIGEKLLTAFESGKKLGRLEAGLDYLDQVLATGEKAISQCQEQIDRESNQEKVLDLYRSLKNVADKVEHDLNRRTQICAEISVLRAGFSQLTTESEQMFSNYLEHELSALKTQSSQGIETLKKALLSREHQVQELSKAFKHLISQPKANQPLESDKTHLKPSSTEEEIAARIQPDFQESIPGPRVSEVIKTLTQALRPHGEGSLGLGRRSVNPDFGLGSIGSESDVVSRQSPVATPRSTNLEDPRKSPRRSPRRLDSTQRKNPPSQGSPQGSTERKRQGLLRQSKSSAELFENPSPKSLLHNFGASQHEHTGKFKIEDLKEATKQMAGGKPIGFVFPKPEQTPAAAPTIISRYQSVSSGPRRFSNNRNNALEQSSTNPMSLVSGGGFTDIHS